MCKEDSVNQKIQDLAAEFKRMASGYRIGPVVTGYDPFTGHRLRQDLACYIVDYINHESERHGKSFKVDDTMIYDAIQSFKSLNEATIIVL